MIREEVTLPDGTIEIREYPAPEAVPEPRFFLPISTMQLSVALFLIGKITEPEARAFGGAGQIPASIESGITAALEAIGKSPGEISAALIIFVAAAEYRREHPLTAVVGAALGLDDAALDALWDAASQIA
jgi:hypothetical protein